MTKNTNEVIIDGVDVSGCKYINTKCESCALHHHNLECRIKPNCYFKQLQRLKKNYDSLTKTIKDTENYSDFINRLKDEILIYPNISGRNTKEKQNVTDTEVYISVLREIINSKQQLKQENEKLQNIKDETYFKLKKEYQLYLKETEDILEKLNKYNKKDMLEMMSSLRQDWHRLFNKKEVIEEKMYKYEECLYEIENTILKLKEAIQENNVADYNLYIDYVLQKINEALDVQTL